MGSNHSKPAPPTPSSPKTESTASNNSNNSPPPRQDLSKTASLSDLSFGTTSTYPSVHRNHRASPLENLPGNRSSAGIPDWVRRYDEYVNFWRRKEEGTAGNADERAAVSPMRRGTGTVGVGGLELPLSSEEHQSSPNASPAPSHNISLDTGPSNGISDVPAEYAVASVGTSGLLYTSQRNNSSESGFDLRRAWLDLYGQMPLDDDGYEMDIFVERRPDGSFRAQFFKIPPPPWEVGGDEGWTVYEDPREDSEVGHPATVKRSAAGKQAEGRKCAGKGNKRGKGKGNKAKKKLLEKQRKTKKEVGGGGRGGIDVKAKIAETNEAEGEPLNRNTAENRQAPLRSAHLDGIIQEPAHDAPVGIKIHSAEMHPEKKLPQLLRDVCLDGIIGLDAVALALPTGEETEGQEDADNVEVHAGDEMEDGQDAETDFPKPALGEQVMEIMRRLQLDGIIGLDVAANELSNHGETEDATDLESAEWDTRNMPCGRDLDPAEVLGLLRKLHLDGIVGLDLVSDSTIQDVGECSTEKVEHKGTSPGDDREDIYAPKLDNLRQHLRLAHLDGIIGRELAAGEPSDVHESESIADLKEAELSTGSENKRPNLSDPEDVLESLRRLQLDGIISFDTVRFAPAHGEEAVWTEEFASKEVTPGDDLKDPGLVELEDLQQLVRMGHLNGAIGLDCAPAETFGEEDAEEIQSDSDNELEGVNLPERERVLAMMRWLNLDGIIGLDAVPDEVSCNQAVEEAAEVGSKGFNEDGEVGVVASRGDGEEELDPSAEQKPTQLHEASPTSQRYPFKSTSPPPRSPFIRRIINNTSTHYQDPLHPPLHLKQSAGNTPAPPRNSTLRPTASIFEPSPGPRVSHNMTLLASKIKAEGPRADSDSSEDLEIARHAFRPKPNYAAPRGSVEYLTARLRECYDAAAANSVLITAEQERSAEAARRVRPVTPRRDGTPTETPEDYPLYIVDVWGSAEMVGALEEHYKKVPVCRTQKPRKKRMKNFNRELEEWRDQEADIFAAEVIRAWEGEMAWRRERVGKDMGAGEAWG